MVISRQDKGLNSEPCRILTFTLNPRGKCWPSVAHCGIQPAMTTMNSALKPLLRGHFHQSAFFFALGASLMLLYIAPNASVEGLLIVYTLTLVGMFGISALYHRPQWRPAYRVWMRRLDHAAIFLSIAGTATPICRLAMDESSGTKLLLMIWLMASLGVFQALFWTTAPRWLTIPLYMICGGLALPYIPQLYQGMGTLSLSLLIAGGAIHALGALVYAFKFPNPLPKTFGFHEIFHLLVILAAGLHFVVIARIVK